MADQPNLQELGELRITNGEQKECTYR
ncbi:hypothetical protein PL9631_560090 [Planktothrix paucivesiculata PCC 9631]|uniref:Uncharacterized protein n=1 Tax=Planktothrix paucivesiculata PCC 9631 TaxID=671071 RepID=A0A7Z9BU89_9CYAN|nr:hypothetical protein PL9631_560090 [Planktothrix paucivesiculata PCC 9631]